MTYKQKKKQLECDKMQCVFTTHVHTQFHFRVILSNNKTIMTVRIEFEAHLDEVSRHKKDIFLI